ncbi:13902_t:CDS:1, partial [Funneliformis geosporum]
FSRQKAIMPPSSNSSKTDFRSANNSLEKSPAFRIGFTSLPSREVNMEEGRVIINLWSVNIFISHCLLYFVV